MEIKQASTSDIKHIIEIQKSDGFNHPYYLNEERLKTLFEKKHIFYLAFINKQPVAFAGLDFDKRTWIHFFSVKEVFQKKGIANEIMKKIVHESRKRKINLIFVIVNENAEKMKGFLGKHGFIYGGEHLDRFGKEKKGLIFNLQLT